MVRPGCCAITHTKTTATAWTDTDFDMELNEYQDRAMRTAIYKTLPVVYPALGLAGEAGEVADKVKKTIRDKGGDFTDETVRTEIAKELGDVMWYLAALARDLGYTLEEIAEMNLAKTQSRASRDRIHGSGDNR